MLRKKILKAVSFLLTATMSFQCLTSGLLVKTQATDEPAARVLTLPSDANYLAGSEAAAFTSRTLSYTGLVINDTSAEQTEGSYFSMNFNVALSDEYLTAAANIGKEITAQFIYAGDVSCATGYVTADGVNIGEITAPLSGLVKISFYTTAAMATAALEAYKTANPGVAEIDLPEFDCVYNEYSGITCSVGMTADASAYYSGTIVTLEYKSSTAKYILSSADTSGAYNPTAAVYTISKTAANAADGVISSTYADYSVSVTGLSGDGLTEQPLAGIKWTDAIPAGTELVSVSYGGSTYTPVVNGEETSLSAEAIAAGFSFDGSTLSYVYPSDSALTGTDSFTVRLALDSAEMAAYLADSANYSKEISNTALLYKTAAAIAEADSSVCAVTFRPGAISGKTGQAVPGNARQYDWDVTVNTSSTSHPTNLNVFVVDVIPDNTVHDYVTGYGVSFTYDGGSTDVAVSTATNSLLATYASGFKIVHNDETGLDEPVACTKAEQTSAFLDYYASAGISAGNAICVKAAEDSTTSYLIVPVPEAALFQSATMFYRTQISEQTYADMISGTPSNITNSVSIIWDYFWYDGGEEFDWDFDAEVIQEVDYNLVRKTCVSTAANGQWVTWRFTVNEAALNFQSLSITDAGIVVDTDSIICKKSDDGGANYSTLTNGGEFSYAYDGTETTTGTLAIAINTVAEGESTSNALYYVEFAARVSDSAVIGGNGTHDIVNSAYYSATVYVDGTPGSITNKTISATAPQLTNTLIEKDAVGDYNYEVAKQGWLISINKSRVLTSASVTDTLPLNTELTGSFTVTAYDAAGVVLGAPAVIAADSTASTAVGTSGTSVAFSYGTGTFTASFTDFNQAYYYTVAYSTVSTARNVVSAVTLTNTAALSGTLYTGVAAADSAAAEVEVEDVPVAKTGVIAYGTSGEDNAECYIDWTAYINETYKIVEGGDKSFTDTVNRTYLTMKPSSVKVYLAGSATALTAGVDYTLASADAGGFTVSFTAAQLSGKSYTVQYRTYVSSETFKDNTDIINTFSGTIDELHMTNATKDNVTNLSSFNWNSYTGLSARTLTITKLASNVSGGTTTIPLSAGFTAVVVENIGGVWTEVAGTEITAATNASGVAVLGSFTKELVYKITESTVPGGYAAVAPFYIAWTGSTSVASTLEAPDGTTKYMTNSRYRKQTMRLYDALSVASAGGTLEFYSCLDSYTNTISGISYTLTNTVDSTLTMTATSDPTTGLVTFTGANPGTYTLTQGSSLPAETTQLANCLAIGAMTVTVTAEDDGYAAEITGADVETHDGKQYIVNKYPKAEIVLNKVAYNNSSAVLPGAVFGVYKDNACSGLVAYIVYDQTAGKYVLSDTDGASRITSPLSNGIGNGANTVPYLQETDGVMKLIPATYYYTELSSPDGFLADVTVRSFTVNSTAAPVLANDGANFEELPRTAQLKITKYIENLGGGALPSGQIIGEVSVADDAHVARFAVTPTGSTALNALTALYPALATYQTNGVVIETGADGTITLGLPAGTYRLVEIAAPDGYIEIDTALNITVTSGYQISVGSYSDALVSDSVGNVVIGDDTVRQLSLEIKNRIRRSAFSVAVDKKYSPDSEAIDFGKVTVEIYENGDLIASAVTNASGVAYFGSADGGDGFAVGSEYTAKAPALGYSGTSEEFTLTEAGGRVATVINTMIYDTLELDKQLLDNTAALGEEGGTSADAGAGYVFRVEAFSTVSGVTLREYFNANDGLGVTIKSNNRIEIATDASGDISLPLPLGSYTITELTSGDEAYATADGSSSFDVALDPNDGSAYVLYTGRNSAYSFSGGVLTVEDTPVGGTISGYVTIQGNSFSKLAGVTVQLYYGDRRLMSTESDADGYYVFENVPFARFIIKQITTPQGYEQVTKSLSVEITAEEPESTDNCLENRSVEEVITTPYYPPTTDDGTTTVTPQETTPSETTTESPDELKVILDEKTDDYEVVIVETKPTEEQKQTIPTTITKIGSVYRIDTTGAGKVTFAKPDGKTTDYEVYVRLDENSPYVLYTVLTADENGKLSLDFVNKFNRYIMLIPDEESAADDVPMTGVVLGLGGVVSSAVVAVAARRRRKRSDSEGSENE